MKRQFQKLFTILITLCIALVMVIGIGSISVAAAEGESTLSLSLVGNSTIYLQKGTEYKEFGAIAYDTVEGDLTESIAIHNTVNKDTVGTYTVSYSVSNASSQTASASRTVIVFDERKDEILKTYNSTSYSYPSFKKIFQLPDGGFILYGERYGSSSDEYTVRFDKDFNTVWSKNDYSISGYDYARDFVVTSEYVVTLSYNSSNTRNYVTIRDIADGTVKARYQIDSSTYTCIDQLSEDAYIVYGDGGISYRILNYNTESNEFTSTKYTTTFELNNSFVFNNCIYAVQSDGSWSKLSLETEELEEGQWDITLSTADYWVTDNEIYFCSYINSCNTLYKLDADMNILKTFTFDEGSSIQEVYAKNDIVLVKVSNKIIFLNNNLETIDSTKSKYSFVANDMILGDDGNVYYVGQYYGSNGGYYSYYWCGISIISDVILFANTDELHSELNDEIDYDYGVDIVDALGNSLGTYTCDYSQVDICKAGNYKAYYTFTAIDNEGIKTYYVSRDIIVEPTTTFEDGATYSGSKVIDVEGGSVTINGEDYSYGDDYNIPGDSTMVITGENGYTKTINFTIELTVEGVENDTTYYTEVVPVISGGEITLDGAPYVSGTPITTKGHHTLIITGANGFSRTINFTIETTIVGVEDGQMYYETLYPNINAENMTLNGVAYNNEPIENCGNYTLTITYVNFKKLSEMIEMTKFN